MCGAAAAAQIRGQKKSFARCWLSENNNKDECHEVAMPRMLTFQSFTSRYEHTPTLCHFHRWSSHPLMCMYCVQQAEDDTAASKLRKVATHRMLRRRMAALPEPAVRCPHSATLPHCKPPTHMQLRTGLAKLGGSFGGECTPASPKVQQQWQHTRCSSHLLFLCLNSHSWHRQGQRDRRRGWCGCPRRWWWGRASRWGTLEL